MRARRALRRHPAAAAVAVVLALAAWNAPLAVARAPRHLARATTRSRSAHLAGGIAETLADGLGSPPTWPASWLFAARHGLPPARYDMLVGRYLFYRQNNQRGCVEPGQPAFEPQLRGGWGARAETADGAVRALAGPGDVYVGLDLPQDLVLRVRASAAQVTPVALAINARDAGGFAVGPGSTTHAIRVPAALWGRDLNVVTLRPAAARAGARAPLRAGGRRGAASLRHGGRVNGVLAAAALAAGVFVLHRVLRRRLEPVVTALVLALTLLGTFALDLVVRLPLLSAAMVFALAAVALYARAQPGPLSLRRAIVIGGAAGLAAAGHAPNAALALLALPSRDEAGRPLGAALLTTTAVWSVLRLTGLAVPFRTGSWEPLLTLFGSRQGLLHLTPALWLGVAGLALQLRRDARAAAPVTLTALALVAWHAACPLGSAACPREEAAALLPLLALPAGLALRALRDHVRRAPAAPLWAAGAALVGSNLLFMQQYAADMIPRDFPVPFPQVARNQAALIARAAGAPLSWPANWIFAARYDTGADHFDAAAGKRVTAAPDGSLTIDVGQLDTDQALLLEGWSVRHPCGEAVCRAVESRARVLLPVMPGGHVTLRVLASGEGRLGVGPLRLDADPAAGDPNARGPLGPEPADLCFVPEAEPGLRAFTLSVSATAFTPRPRALVDRITLSPAPCP